MRWQKYKSIASYLAYQLMNRYNIHEQSAKLYTLHADYTDANVL